MSTDSRKSLSVLKTPTSGGRHLLCIYRLNLTAYEKFLLVYIGGRLNHNDLTKYGKFTEDSYLRISVTDLSKELSLSETTVKSNLKILIDKGYITKKNIDSNVGRSYANHYYVTEKIFLDYENLINKEADNRKKELEIKTTKISSIDINNNNYIDSNQKHNEQKNDNDQYAPLNRAAKERIDQMTAVMFTYSDVFDGHLNKKKMELPFHAKSSLLAGIASRYGMDKMEQFYSCVLDCNLIGWVQADGEWLTRIFDHLPLFIRDRRAEHKKILDNRDSQQAL